MHSKSQNTGLNLAQYFYFYGFFLVTSKTGQGYDAEQVIQYLQLNWKPVFQILNDQLEFPITRKNSKGYFVPLNPVLNVSISDF